MGVVVFLVYHGLYRILGLSNSLSLLIAAGIGIILYIGVCYVFGVEEIKLFIIKARDRMMNYFQGNLYKL